MSVEDLRKSDVMAHLLDALDQKKDIGHYGRLVFAMVARYFLSEDEVVAYLRNSPGFGEEDTRGLFSQVSIRGYSPPKRETILEWQREQEFPICPNAEDPDACNVYKDLRFPDEVYAHIYDYYERKSGAA